MKSALRLAIPVLVAIASLVPAGSAIAEAPAITWPSEGDLVNSLTMTYNLPEDANAGSVKLVFTGAADRTLVMINDLAGSPTIKLNLGNLLTSGGVKSVTGGSTLPDGAYSVTLEYEDTLSTPHSSAARAFTLDTVTLAPLITSPTTDSAITSSQVGINFTLPEAALRSSVKFLFHPTDGGSGYHTVTLDSYGVAQGIVSVNVAHPDWSFGVLSAAPTTAIAPGEYDISLSYQDAAGNTAAKHTVKGIRVGGWVPSTRIGLVRPGGGKLRVKRSKGTFAITFNGAGTVTLVAKSSKGKVLGTGKVTYTSSGRKTATLALNSAGKRAFSRSGRAGLRVTLQASGTAAGKAAGKASLAVKLVG